MTAKRRAISRIGGKCSIAALAKTTPMPQMRATAIPSPMSCARRAKVGGSLKFVTDKRPGDRPGPAGTLIEMGSDG